jgi:hypothetical protein
MKILRQCVVLLVGASNLVVEFQFAALQLLCRLFPFAGSSGTLSMEDMSDALLSILVFEHKIVATPTLNANLVRGTAVVGITAVTTIFRSAAEICGYRDSVSFLKSVKNCSITKSTTKETENAFGAELYNLFLSLLQIKARSLLTISLLKS